MAYAIADASGCALPLVDIGANLTRVGRPAAAAQLARGAAYGVTRVVVTGCDLAGSRKAASFAQWHAATATATAGAARVYCTSGIHPHDAKTAWADGA